MRRFYFLSIVLLFVSMASWAEQTYRLEVGYVQPYQKSDDFRNTYFHGAKLGGTVDFHFPYSMTIQTGLFYSFAYGYNQQNFSTQQGIEHVTRNIYSHTVDVPVRYTYTQTIWKDLALFAYAGPNFQVGLAQTEDVNTTLTDHKADQFGIRPGVVDAYQVGDLRRFNFQLGVGGGVQWAQYRIQSGYDFGMFSASSKAQVNQNGWYVSVSYAF